MREVAEVLDLPLSRVEHEWRFARSWLQKEVESFDPSAGRSPVEGGDGGGGEP